MLRAFEAAEAGVLVGTQMVAKGHDFPDVTLGVVLDADATLRFPDFRAEERTFALVAQLAGRSGRGRARRAGDRAGARAAGARAAATPPRTTPAGFLADELPRREAFAYPPYGHLIRVVCSLDRARPRARGGRRPSAELIEAAGVPVLGPAPLFRRQARHRAQLVVRSRERAPAIVAVRAAVEAVAADRRHARGGVRGGRGPAVAPQLDSRFMAEGEQEPVEVEAVEVEAVEPEEAPPLDPEVEARRVAAMSFIRRLGDPVLKSRATPVDRFDDSLRRQVSRMAGIMNDALGVGLAAPQLGISQRLLVYRVGPDAPVIALANPELEWASGEVELGEEGCLSIPGIAGRRRPPGPRARARARRGGRGARGRGLRASRRA